MSNNWVDIGNTSLVYIQGANPAENHPACMAHINNARFDGFNRNRKAQMIVVDPRLTRTARQMNTANGDRFVRIRPGTDIAFINSVMNRIFTRMDEAFANPDDTDHLKAENFFAWHNGTAPNSTATRGFINNAGGTTNVTGFPKYCDSRVRVELKTTGADGDYWDYMRADKVVGSDTISNFLVLAADVNATDTVFAKMRAHMAKYPTATAAAICGCTTDDIDFVADALIKNSRFASADFGAIEANCTTPDYRATTFLYAMGITQHTYGSQNVRTYAVIQTFLGNMGRMGGGINALRGIHNVQGSTDMGMLFDGIPGYSASPKTSQVYADYSNQLFGNRMLGTGAKNQYLRKDLGLQQLGFYNMTVQWFGEPVVGTTTAVANSPMFVSAFAWAALKNKNIGASVVVTNKAGTTTYAEGTDYEVDRTGGRIRALKNSAFTNAWLKVSYTHTGGTVTVTNEDVPLVSTERAVVRYPVSTLAGSAAVDAASVVVKHFSGTPTYVEGTDYVVDYATGTIKAKVGSALADGQIVKVSYARSTVPVTDELVAIGIKGLPNPDIKKASPSTFVVTSDPIGTTYADTDYAVTYISGALAMKAKSVDTGTALLVSYEYYNNQLSSGDFEKLYDCWPKGNGYQHIESFRRMKAGDIKAAVIWGQNPAITEPNQTAVRAGLKNLELMVVTDMFATETAQASRKTDGVTYLLPACSHVEEAGSVSNSGRWIQWRERACKPQGNSKADLELLLTFSKYLADGGLFDHIIGKWKDTTAYASKVVSLDAAVNRKALWTSLYGKYGWDAYSAATLAFEDVPGTSADGVAVEGSEVMAEKVFMEIARPLDDPTVTIGGTLWIYSGMGSASAFNSSKSDVSPAMGTAWPTINRAKSRLGAPAYASSSFSYPRYGWAWLLNRRLMYNNSEIPQDVADVFVGPGYLSRQMTFTTAHKNTLANWSTVYRAYNTLGDIPSAGLGTVHVLPGNFPAHTEPYESPSPTLTATWGKNLKKAAGSSTAGTQLIVAPGNANGWTPTPVGTFGDSYAGDFYDLVLTTIRCVEHFQGGPTTRNNAWNHEAEPEPWVEINSVDAVKFGIKDGDYVDVVTARGNSIASQVALNKADADAASFAKGFKARVGVGTLANQRVAPGVVAIPWHWGERGLSKGSRANDLCIDAWDANTAIPEYKACLCRIRKVGA